jgi:hypothetical protein
VNFERRTFVAWNPKFLERTGFTEDEMKSFKPEELLIFGESWSPLSGEAEDQRVEYITCSTRGPFRGASAPGLVVRAQGRMGYVMLDVFGSSAQFEQGFSAGREEERSRIINAFHQEVSSPLIAALFLIQRAKNELEDTGLPQALFIENTQFLRQLLVSGPWSGAAGWFAMEFLACLSLRINGPQSKFARGTDYVSGRSVS